MDGGIAGLSAEQLGARKVSREQWFRHRASPRRGLTNTIQNWKTKKGGYNVRRDRFGSMAGKRESHSQVLGSMLRSQFARKTKRRTHASQGLFQTRTSADTRGMVETRRHTLDQVQENLRAPDNPLKFVPTETNLTHTCTHC